MNTKTILALMLVVVLFGIVAFAFYKKGNNSQEASVGSNIQVTSTPVATVATESTTMDNGLKIQDLKVGTGPQAKAGDVVAVNYLGTLQDGTKFDSSYDRGQSFQFLLGSGEVIKGWDIGVAGMKVGGKRKLVIPSDLAYGERRIGPIPPNATLVFEVELLAVQAPK